MDSPRTEFGRDTAGDDWRTGHRDIDRKELHRRILRIEAEAAALAERPPVAPVAGLLEQFVETYHDATGTGPFVMVLEDNHWRMATALELAFRAALTPPEPEPADR